MDMIQIGEQKNNAPSHPVSKLSDTLGAGDTFMASMLVWLTGNNHIGRLQGLRFDEKREMQSYASPAAMFNCEKQGCNPPWASDLG